MTNRPTALRFSNWRCPVHWMPTGARLPERKGFDCGGSRGSRGSRGSPRSGGISGGAGLRRRERLLYKVQMTKNGARFASSVLAALAAAAMGWHTLQQCRRPTGWLRRLIVGIMNRSHAGLISWGLTHVQVNRRDALLDVFRFSWKWRKRSPIKIMERTHEEATEALHAGRESRHPAAASVGAGPNLRVM